MRKLLGARVHNDQTKRVMFNELPIPLAVIGCNYLGAPLEVYSRNTVGGSDGHKGQNIDVAEAVRRSMSLPLIFEPRGADYSIIDGGVCSSFPAWLMTPASDHYWPTGSASSSRVKVGFTLAETKDAPSSWRAHPAKFRVSGTNGRVNGLDVAASVVTAALKEHGLFLDSPTFPESSVKEELKSLKFLDVLTGFLSVEKESSTRVAIVSGLMRGLPYFDVEIRCSASTSSTSRSTGIARTWTPFCNAASSQHGRR
jgi:predicted acylesterase/phospholipase RssA